MFPVKVSMRPVRLPTQNGRFANTGTIGKELSQEFHGLGWEGPQELR